MILFRYLIDIYPGAREEETFPFECGDEWGAGVFHLKPNEWAKGWRPGRGDEVLNSFAQETDHAGADGALVYFAGVLLPGYKGILTDQLGLESGEKGLILFRAQGG